MKRQSFVMWLGSCVTFFFFKTKTFSFCLRQLADESITCTILYSVFSKVWSLSFLVFFVNISCYSPIKSASFFVTVKSNFLPHYVVSPIYLYLSFFLLSFHLQGAHLPTPPPPQPIPDYIQRSLDWIAAHPEREEPVRQVVASAVASARRF